MAFLIIEFLAGTPDGASVSRMRSIPRPGPKNQVVASRARDLTSELPSIHCGDFGESGWIEFLAGTSRRAASRSPEVHSFEGSVPLPPQRSHFPDPLQPWHGTDRFNLNHLPRTMCPFVPSQWLQRPEPLQNGQTLGPCFVPPPSMETRSSVVDWRCVTRTR